MRRWAWMLPLLWLSGCAITKVEVRYEEYAVAIELEEGLMR